jgi:hypothetical protein
MFSLVVLCMLGIEVVRRTATRRIAIACAAIVFASWVLAFVWVVRGARPSATQQFVVDSAAAIHRDAAGAPCRVLATAVQVQWYCRCETAPDIYAEHIGNGRNYVIITPFQYPLDRSVLPGKQVVLLEHGDMTLLRLDPR